MAETIRSMVIDQVKDMFDCEAEDVIHLESSKDRTVWYGGFKESEKVSAFLVIVDLEDLSPSRVKVVPEEMGPFGFGPSKELFDKLTPTENETALLWRSGCQTLLNGGEIIGNPYQTFSDSFIQGIDAVVSLTAEKERATYLRGIKDRYAGVEMGDMPDDYFIQWMDGWMWANNQIEVDEIQRRE